MKYKNVKGETVVVTPSAEDKKLQEIEKTNADLVSQLEDMYLLMADMIAAG